MILACSSCHTRYLVSAALFSAGPRMVRCSRCHHLWTEEIPAETGTVTVKVAAEINPSIIPLTTPPSLPKTKEKKSIWQSDWAMAGITMTVACLLLWAAIDRRDIAERWPVTEAVYDHVGLHIFHAGEGLALVDVRSEMKYDGGITQLTVEGQIHNKTDKPQSIPDILAAAIGPDGKIMQSWQIDAPAATLGPGESAPFSSEIHAPQGTVVNINLHFIEMNNNAS